MIKLNTSANCISLKLKLLSFVPPQKTWRDSRANGTSSEKRQWEIWFLEGINPRWRSVDVRIYKDTEMLSSFLWRRKRFSCHVRGERRQTKSKPIDRRGPELRNSNVRNYYSTGRNVIVCQHLFWRTCYKRPCLTTFPCKHQVES